MRIVTLNANGIRAAARKGFFDWLPQQNADVVCLQETKAQAHQLTDPMFSPSGYYCYYHDAQKRGYSGVAVYARQQPDDVVEGVGWDELDNEGRWLEARFGKLSVVSFYLPSGSSGDERQQVKYRFMDFLMDFFKRLRRRRREYIVCGDWNIAHKQIDIENWRSNQKRSGFLPDERAWLDKLFDQVKYVDAFRVVDRRDKQYTWWSNRGRAWDKNVGWRLDYHVVTPKLKDCVRRAEIYKVERFSDHAPLTIDYEL